MIRPAPHCRVHTAGQERRNRHGVWLYHYNNHRPHSACGAQPLAPHRLRRQAPDLTPPRQRRQRHDQLQRVAVYEHAERRRGLDKEGEDREGAVEVMANAALIVAASEGLQIQWLIEPSIELQQTLELFAVLLAP